MPSDIMILTEWVMMVMIVYFVATRLTLTNCLQCEVPYCSDCIDTPTCEKVTMVKSISHKPLFKKNLQTLDSFMYTLASI